MVVATAAGWLVLASMAWAERAATRAVRMRWRRDLGSVTARWRRRAAQGLAMSGIVVGGAALAWSLSASRDADQLDDEAEGRAAHPPDRTGSPGSG